MNSTEHQSQINGKKKTNLFLILSGFFITNAVLAEIIGVKIFSFEKTLGFQPAQLNIFKDAVLDFNLTAGAVIWPFVFIFTDIINEYFGRSGVRKVSFLTAGLIVYAFFIIWIVTLLAPASFWLEINSTYGNNQPFNVHDAFNKILMQGQNIMVASITAFLVGQLLDAWVFHRLKLITGSKMIWLRATGSTLISQFIDSFLVLLVAFHLLGNWSLDDVFAIGLINYIYKVGAAILLTPLLYLVHFIIDRYLDREKEFQS